MHIDLLGPLVAHRGGVSFVPTAVKPKKVLALLALNANRFVQLQAIENELWGTTPPKSALTTIQTYIMQIRKRMDAALDGDGPRAKDVLITGTTGYQLRILPPDLDLARYQDLIARGELALTSGKYDRAACLFADALAVWRDDALVDVRHGPAIETEVRELDASRTLTLERRIEAELRLGQHYGVLTELAVLTRRHPFNENLHGQFMRALYRSGRRAEALSLYRRVRERFIGELGIDPSPRLRELHQIVLNCDDCRGEVFSPSTPDVKSAC
ncbi:BTAD domain-containing putative transcriptional regulator [Amycolatopsis sp. cmx-11-12]|uniref:AfsR/SARP family transcriptional regulator n=1 Tax=Amycolatopsis sp. cmx-11-12 TaxID=2785795 RepID=UPI0039172FD6